jgi:hypothetical protein
VTGRAVFGDFLDAARSHLGTADGLRPAAGGDADIQEVSRGLLRLVRIMGQYVQDVTTGWGPEPPWPRRRVLTGWTRAGVDAREAIGNAAAFLNEPNARRRRPRGERQLRSKWGLVVTSPPVARAVLSEMRSLARDIAPIGAGLALAPHSRGTREARQKLNAACQWLWVLNASVNAAQRQEPVSASDLELLRTARTSSPGTTTSTATAASACTPPPTFTTAGPRPCGPTGHWY